MKRTNKIITAAVAVLIIGVVVWVVGMSLIGWNFNRLDTTVYTAQSYSCKAEVKSISVSLSSFPLTVKKGDKVSLDYYEADNSEVFVEEKDGVLSVVENYKYRPFSGSLFNIGRSSHKYTLTVVSGVKLAMKGSNSDVSVADIVFDEFTIDSTNTDISLTRVQCGKLSVDVTNCGIDMDDCKASDMIVDATNLDMTAKNCEFNSVAVDVTNCDIDMRGCKASDMIVDATNLDMTAKSCEFKSVAIDGTNTDCELIRAVLDKLSVKATNIDAELEIVGKESEYTVKTNGRRMPANRTGTTDKLIELSGTNNDVTLKFV